MKKAIAIICVLMSAAACRGRERDSRGNIVSVRVLDPSSRPGPGALFSVFIEVRVRPGFHVNSSEPGDELLFPAAVEVAGGSGLRLERAVFPEGRRVDVAFSRGPVSVLDGVFKVELQLKLDPDYADKKVELKGGFRFQACDDKTCLPPASAVFAKTLRVKSP
jgi:hypothetical protein